MFIYDQEKIIANQLSKMSNGLRTFKKCDNVNEKLQLL